MLDLTPRQVQILRHLIEEYIERAEPVGSETLDKKFNLGVSPATIRNEMVYLTKQGYLQKTHSSAGRVPTPRAMKLYVNELMKEKELSVSDEVSAKEKVWESRREVDDLLQHITKVVADRTHALGISMQTSDRHIFHAGYANLLHMPEFYDINVIRQVFSLIEEFRQIQQIFEMGSGEHNPIQVVYGAELGNKYLEPISVIFVTCQLGSHRCYVGAIGSHRFDYSYVVPTMKFVRSLLEEVSEV